MKFGLVVNIDVALTVKFLENWVNDFAEKCILERGRKSKS